MTQPRLLNHGRLPAPLVARLAAAYKLHDLTAEADRAGYLAANGGASDAVVTSAGVGADATPSAALPRLPTIAQRSTGFDTARGLDVFENEPLFPAELLALDNVVLLPHIASATRETHQAMSDLVFDNLRCYFAEGQVAGAVP